MAKIIFDKVRHSYFPSPKGPEDYALQGVDFTWVNGGAYALLGPSGCGKTTLLNIISGLLTPSEGRILFNDVDVTNKTTNQRKIAQVFQFPVVYDTMTVYDNLAFPLKNRGIFDQATIQRRVYEIAEMLDLTNSLKNKASGLTADGKQKISLGRGLVRDDVNAVLFDEPLTVIDPHLKWSLRSKLKELHQQVGQTMIYVTHDQTEALTFADKVVVMYAGKVVQVGTPVELFEKPQHTFVGHFIGSPGMNLLPCRLDDNKVYFKNYLIDTQTKNFDALYSNEIEIGIRPEFVSFSTSGIPVELIKVNDIGSQRILELRHEEYTLKMILGEDADIPSGALKVQFKPEYTHVYSDSWLVEE